LNLIGMSDYSILKIMKKDKEYESIIKSHLYNKQITSRKGKKILDWAISEYKRELMMYSKKGKYDMIKKQEVLINELKDGGIKSILESALEEIEKKDNEFSKREENIRIKNKPKKKTNVGEEQEDNNSVIAQKVFDLFEEKYVLIFLNFIEKQEKKEIQNMTRFVNTLIEKVDQKYASNFFQRLAKINLENISSYTQTLIDKFERDYDFFGKKNIPQQISQFEESNKEVSKKQEEKTIEYVVNKDLEYSIDEINGIYNTLSSSKLMTDNKRKADTNYKWAKQLFESSRSKKDVIDVINLLKDNMGSDGINKKHLDSYLLLINAYQSIGREDKSSKILDYLNEKSINVEHKDAVFIEHDTKKRTEFNLVYRVN
jgi:hypothetical protein